MSEMGRKAGGGTYIPQESSKDWEKKSLLLYFINTKSIDTPFHKSHLFLKQETIKDAINTGLLKQKYN